MHLQVTKYPWAQDENVESEHTSKTTWISVTQWVGHV